MGATTQNTESENENEYKNQRLNGFWNMCWLKGFWNMCRLNGFWNMCRLSFRGAWHVAISC